MRRATKKSKPVPVTVESFVRAETDGYFKKYASGKGRKLGRLMWRRDVSPVDDQTIVRQNRDTLYGSAVFDLDAGPVTIKIPDPGSRFFSMQTWSQDQYTPGVHYKGGAYTFTKEKVGSRYVLIAFRILVNSNGAADVQKGRDLQDAVAVEQPGGPGKVEFPNWDPESHERVRKAVLTLADTLPDSNRMFGMPDDVDPIRHLCGTASLWGGNKPEDAIYLNFVPEKNDGKAAYRFSVKDVPVDGFWSVIVYDKNGYIPQNKRKVYSFNNLTAKPDKDGSVTIQFGGNDSKALNCIPIVKGWNYTVRLYRPRKEILDGRWKFPDAVLLK